MLASAEAYSMFVLFGFVSIVMLIGSYVLVVLCCFVLFSWGILIVVVINSDVEV